VEIVLSFLGTFSNRFTILLTLLQVYHVLLQYSQICFFVQVGQIFISISVSPAIFISSIRYCIISVFICVFVHLAVRVMKVS
jgi:hypothetical protein